MRGFHVRRAQKCPLRRAKAYDFVYAVLSAGRPGRGALSSKRTQTLRKRKARAGIVDSWGGAPQPPRRPRRLAHLPLPGRAAAPWQSKDTVQACPVAPAIMTVIMTVAFSSLNTALNHAARSSRRDGCWVRQTAWASCRRLLSSLLRSHTICARAAGAPQADDSAAASGPACC